MRTLHLICVSLHVIAAAAWLGGMAFFAGVLMPLLRSPALAPTSAPLVDRLAPRMRIFGWSAFATLLATGLAQVALRGLPLSTLVAGFDEGPMSRVLAAKFALFAALVALAALHDFVLGPRALAAARRAPGTPEALHLRRLAGLVGRLEFALTLVIVGLAVAFVRGGI